MKKTGFFLIPEMVKFALGRVATLLFLLILFIIDASFCPIYLIFKFLYILFDALATAVAKAGLILADLEEVVMKKI